MCEHHQHLPAEEVVDLGVQAPLAEQQQTTVLSSRDEMHKVIPGGPVYFKADDGSVQRTAEDLGVNPNLAEAVLARADVDARRAPKGERVIKPKSKRQLAKEAKSRKKRDAEPQSDPEYRIDDIPSDPAVDKLVEEIQQAAGKKRMGKKRRRRK